METWNIVITVHEGCYSLVREVLQPLGSVRKTEYYNVLVMTVADTRQALERIRAMIVEQPELRDAIARFVPAAQTFFLPRPRNLRKRPGKRRCPWSESWRARPSMFA